MGCYTVGELGHLLIGIISKPIAQDMKFGEQGCIANDSSLPWKDQQSCTSKNNTMYLFLFFMPIIIYIFNKNILLCLVEIV